MVICDADEPDLRLALHADLRTRPPRTVGACPNTRHISSRSRGVRGPDNRRILPHSPVAHSRVAPAPLPAFLAPRTPRRRATTFNCLGPRSRAFQRSRVRA